MNVFFIILALFFFVPNWGHSENASLEELRIAWGLPGHTAANDTIFGVLAKIDARVTPAAPNALARFKSTIIGRYDGDCADDAELPFSLFSECVEIARFLRTPNIPFSNEQLSNLARLVGTSNDSAPTTLFGALNLLLEKMEDDYETIAPLIGIDSQADTSVFHHLKQIQIQLLPDALDDVRDDLPFLTNTSLQELVHSGSAGLLSVLRQDVIQRLSSSSKASLLSQLQALRTELDFVTADARPLIGADSPLGEAEDCDSLTLIARLHRLTQDIQTASSDQIAALYPQFFYGANAFQTVLNELKGTTASSLEAFFSKIGTPFRFDASLFGHLNSALKALEVDPTLRVFYGPTDPSDPSDKTVIERLESVYQKNWQEAELERVVLALGTETEPEGLTTTTLLSALSYVATSWERIALFCPYEKMRSHRTLISVNLPALAQRISECTEVDTLYVLCGGTTDTDTKTLWGMVRTLLSDLSQALLDILEPKRSALPSLEAFFESYTEAREILQRVITHYHESLFRLDGASFLKKLWDSPAPPFEMRSTLDSVPFLDSGQAEGKDDLPFFLRIQELSNAPSADAAKLAALETTFQEGIHLLAFGLAHDRLTNSAPENLEEAIRALNALGLFEDSIVYVGSREDAAPSDPTVFALMANVARLLGDPSFFWSRLKAYLMDNSKLTNFSPFSIFSLLGSPHDTSDQSLTKRTFFAAIDHLKVLSKHAVPASQKNNVSATIGRPDALPGAGYHSLFSLLNTMVSNLFKDAVGFFLAPAASSLPTTSFVDRLDTFLNQARSKGYLASPLLSALTELGSFETKTGVFETLYELQTKMEAEEITPTFRYNFLVTMQELLQLMDQFEATFPPARADETEAFCQQIRKLVHQLEFTHSCESCGSLIEVLSTVGQQLVGWGLTPWTERTAERVFAQATFEELSRSVQGVKTALDAFKAGLQLYTSRACALKECLKEKLALAEALEEVQGSVQKLMDTGGLRLSSFEQPSLLDGECTDLPTVLEQISEGLASWSQSWKLPPADTYVYNRGQDDAWKAIAQNTKALASCVTDILTWAAQETPPRLCPSCRLEGWSQAMDQMKEVLPAFAKRTQEIANFIEEQTQQRIASQWERIGTLIQKRQSLADASSESVWGMINTLDSAESFDTWAQAVEGVANALQGTLDASHEGMGEEADAAFDALETSIRGALPPWSQLRFQTRASLMALEETPPSASSGNSMTTILNEMAQAVQLDEDLGAILLQATQAPQGELETAAAVIPLERLGAAYGKLAMVLQGEERFSEEEGAFPYNLFSADAHQTLQASLATLRERFDRASQMCTGTAQALRSLCPQTMIAVLKTLAAQEERLAILISTIPSSFWDLPLNLERVATLWAEKMRIVANLSERMTQDAALAESGRCLHFVLRGGLARLNELVEELVQELLDVTEGRNPGLKEVSMPLSASQAREFLEEAITRLTSGLEEMFDHVTPLTNCAAALSTALISLRDSGQRLAQSLETLEALPLCAVEGALAFPTSDLLQARARVWGAGNVLLTSNLQCITHNAEALKPLVPLVQQIVQCIKAELQTVPTEDALTKQAEALNYLNAQTLQVVAFFQTAEEGACVSQLPPLLKNVEEALERFQHVFPETLPPLPAPSRPDSDLIMLTDAMLYPLQELRQAVTIALSSKAVPSFATEKEGLTLQATFQKMTDAVQSATEISVQLSEQVFQAAPHFGCVHVLEELAAHLEHWADDACLIAGAMTTYVLRIESCVDRFAHERRYAAIEPAILYDGLDQKAWLQRTLTRHATIQRELEKLRTFFGFRPPQCMLEHSFPLNVVVDPGIWTPEFGNL